MLIRSREILEFRKITLWQILALRKLPFRSRSEMLILSFYARAYAASRKISRWPSQSWLQSFSPFQIQLQNIKKYLNLILWQKNNRGEGGEQIDANVYKTSELHNRLMARSTLKSTVRGRTSIFTLISLSYISPFIIVILKYYIFIKVWPVSLREYFE